MAMTSRREDWGPGSSGATRLDMALADFRRRQARGESPRAEAYAGELSGDELVEVVYLEYCLAGDGGPGPKASDYVERFPSQAEALGRLFRAHEAFASASLKLWSGPADDAARLPQVGDEVGPYVLVRELGRGGGGGSPGCSWRSRPTWKTGSWWSRSRPR